MILKLGKVYRYGSKLILVTEKRRFKRRLIYTIRQVYASGVLGPEAEKMFSRGSCKIVPGCQIITYVKLPIKTAETEKFANLTKRARKLIKEKKSGYQKEVAKLAYCCANYQHETEGRACNLRDFARGVKFKSFNVLYQWVHVYLTGLYTDDKYKTAIPKSADSTVIKMVRTHNDTLGSYYGFNRKLNDLLDQNVSAYIQEFNLRGLEL